MVENTLNKIGLGKKEKISDNILKALLGVAALEALALGGVFVDLLLKTKKHQELVASSVDKQLIQMLWRR